MKEPLYYSVRLLTLYPYVVAVTSEKSSRYGRTRWYGRDCRYNEATHGTADQLRGKFATQVEAESAVSKIKEVHDYYKERRDSFQKWITALNNAERKAIADLFKEV